METAIKSAWTRLSVPIRWPMGNSRVILMAPAWLARTARSDAVVLPSAVVACKTCTQGPHQPTFDVWLSTQNIPDCSSAGPAKQAREEGAAASGEATAIVRHARHWHAAIRTTLPTRPLSPRVSPGEPSKPAGQGETTYCAGGVRMWSRLQWVGYLQKRAWEAVFIMLPTSCEVGSAAGTLAEKDKLPGCLLPSLPFSPLLVSSSPVQSQQGSVSEPTGSPRRHTESRGMALLLPPFPSPSPARLGQATISPRPLF